MSQRRDCADCGCDVSCHAFRATEDGKGAPPQDCRLCVCKAYRQTLKGARRARMQATRDRA